MKLNQLKNDAVMLKEQLQRLINDFNKLENNTDQSSLNADDLYIFDSIYQITDKSHDIVKIIEYMNKPIISEGYLTKNNNGRYELNGYELSSGHPLDVWEKDDFYINGGSWVRTRIEHKNDYYAVALGVDKPLDGLKARIK